ncbi:MAG: 2-hydroxyglutaryl-CoA dehydratase [Dehalococcoidales bacterium]|nr:2-hydroxyglutaryl-CoA dehydratase [Dehalococcoidales bacterium]
MTAIYYFAGIDLGSTMTKLAVVDEEEKLLASVIHHTGAEHRRLANKVMEDALAEAGLSIDDIACVIATGYGRINVPFADKQVTELTCHTRGIVSMFPTVRLAVDIGGQDSKGLKIRNGKLVDFAMNDRCAAGTGRFLEVFCDTLGLEVRELGEISLKSTNKAPISNTCTVFARQEVIAHISKGVPIEDIVAGLHDAVAARVARMVKKLKVEPDVVFTGGVAKNTGVVRALEENLGCDVFVPDEPLITGALGAALLAKDQTVKALAQGKPVEKRERRLEEATFFESL